jgi:peptide/nickel transport system substrate-binding protein
VLLVRRKVVLTAVLAAALVAAGCGGGGGSDAGTASNPQGSLAGPDQSIAVAGSEPAQVDFHKNVDNGGRLSLGQVYETLYIADKGGQIVPLLADGQPTRIDDATYEIKLKTGVTFSDGTPFNADSAVFSINRVVSPQLATQLADVSTIAGAEKVDDTTVRVKTKTASPLLANRLMTTAMYRPTTTDPTKPDQIIGTGPYKVVSYTPGTGTKLTYNEKYRGDKPQVTAVEVRFIPDAGTRVQAISAGEVDVVPEITPLEAKGLQNVVATSKPAWSAFVRLNTLTGGTEDVKLRQAMNYAVDRDAIVTQVFGDQYASTSQCTPLPMGTGGTSSNVKMPYTYDPEKAKQLVNEAGANGRTIEMISSSGAFTEDRAVAELVAQSLNAIGLKINLQYLSPFSVYSAQLIKSQTNAPPMTFAGMVDSRSHVDRALQNYYSSSGPPSAFNDPEVDKLITEATSAADQQAAQPVYDRLLQRACDEAAYIYLFDYKTIFGLSPRIKWEPGVDSFGWNLRYDQMQVYENE